jgi:hypothetical protein
MVERDNRGIDPEQSLIARADEARVICEMIIGKVDEALAETDFKNSESSIKTLFSAIIGIRSAIINRMISNSEALSRNYGILEGAEQLRKILEPSAGDDNNDELDTP